MKLIKQLYNCYFSSDRQIAQQLYRMIGYRPINLSLYKVALIHRSLARKNHANNERLEYLGDAIIGSAVAHFLYTRFPKKSEGFLTEMRAKIVNRKQLNFLAEAIGLNELIQFNRSDPYLRNSRSIFGNGLEALVGAIYIDHGYKRSCNFVGQKLMGAHLDLNKLEKTEQNFKSKLLEWADKNGRNVYFKKEKESYEGKQKVFYMQVYVDEKLSGTGRGLNKKNAEQEAASKALKVLQI